MLPPDKKTTPFTQCGSLFHLGVLAQGDAIAAVLQPWEESLTSDGGGLKEH